MVRESNQNVYLIMIDASSFAEFEIPEFEISRVDCTYRSIPIRYTSTTILGPVALHFYTGGVLQGNR